jgi:quinol monooxygenase YgiN
MKTTKARHGFRATMRALPGKGDEVVHVLEGWTSREAHAANFASEWAKAFAAKLAPLVSGEAQYQDEVPIGGKWLG